MRVGSHSILDSLNVGIYVSVVGTTFKTLILETNPFLVRTNGFTADLAFVGNRETEAKRDGAINIVSPFTNLCWLNFPPKKLDKRKLGQISGGVKEPFRKIF